MNEKIKNYLGIAGTASLVMLTLLLIVGTYATYTLSRGIDPTQYRSFTVSAEGKINTVPDIARFSFSIITQGDTDVESLQKENTEKANSMINLIKDAGVADLDIQTTNYNVNPRYTNYRCNFRGPNSEPCPPSEITGYTVSQNISIKIRDFDIIGKILAGVTKSGANTISGPYFTIEDTDNAKSQARAEAIEKAKEKAQEIAKAGGFRLGKLLSINETGGYYPRNLRGDVAIQEFTGAEAVAPTIEPGSQDVKASVTLRYEIK